jgi:hypothetical protein
MLHVASANQTFDFRCSPCYNGFECTENVNGRCPEKCGNRPSRSEVREDDGSNCKSRGWPPCNSLASRMMGKN